MTSDEKTLNTKFDHLSKIKLLHRSFSHLRNFYQTLVTNPWFSYRLSKTMSHTCEIWTAFCLNFLKWKNSLYKDCISWWAKQTWYSKLFNLKSFRVHNTRVKVLFFIWPNLTWSNLLKWDTKWPLMKKLWIQSLIISARSTIVTYLIFPFEKVLSNSSHKFLNLI